MKITLRGGGSLGINSMPDRKRKALYREHGCTVYPIAYFMNDEDAEWVEHFLETLVSIANGENK